MKYRTPTVINVRIFQTLPNDRYIEDLNVAKDVYHELNIDFNIIGIEPICPNNWEEYIYHSSLYEDSLNIYYDFPDTIVFGRFSTPSFIIGRSNFPWTDDNFIIISYDALNYTFAHELGHYFGLLHTFDEGEILTDTFSQTEIDIPYDEYNNIMNYHSNERFSFATPQQIETMRYYLFTDRQKILRNP